MSTQARADILLSIRSDVSELRNTIAELKKAKAEVSSFAKQGAGLAIGFGAVNAVFRGVSASFKAMVSDTLVEGVRFNATLEQARLGVASVLKTFNPQQYKTFNQAVAASGEVIDQLKKKALETPATFEELLSGFQGTAGAMSRAGIPLQKQVDLMVNVSQAMAALGIRNEEMRQEATALMMGNIDRNARLAQTLGITKAQVEAARDQGKLYEFLTDKMKEFSEAGKMAQNNISVLESNLTDARTQVAAEGTKELSEAYRDLLISITALVRSDGFKILFREAADTASWFTKKATSVANYVKGSLDKTPAAITGGFGREADDVLKSRNGASGFGDIFKAEKEAYALIAKINASLDGQLGVVIRDRNEILKKLTDGLATPQAEILKGNKEKNDNAAKSAQATLDKNNRDEAIAWLEKNASKTDQLQIKSQLLDKTDESRLATLKEIIDAKEDEHAAEVYAAKSAEEAEVAYYKGMKDLLPLLKEREQIETRTAKAKETQSAKEGTDAAKAALHAAEINRREIENSVYMTKEEKREALKKSLIAENVEIDKNIASLKKRQGLTKDETVKRSYDTEINSLGDKRATNTADIGTKFAPQSFAQQLAEQIARMKDSFRTLAQSITDVMGGAVSSLSSSFDGLFQGTMTAGSAVQNFFKGIGQSVTKSISDMAAQWVIKHTLMAAVSKVFHVQDVAMTTEAESLKTGITLKGAAIRIGTAIKEALAAVWGAAVNVFKAFSSLGPWGMVAGIAAMAGAVVLGMNAVKNIHLADGGVFHGSGKVSGPGHSKEDAVNARLSDGEVVIQEPSARKIGYDRLAFMNKNGELPAFSGGGLFSKIGAAVGKASGWKSWGQFLGSGGLSKKVTGGVFDKFQEQYNLMDGTKLYGGGPTGAESKAPTSDQIAAAQLERAGTTSANMDYVSSMANRGTAQSVAASSASSSGGAAGGSAGQAINLNNYNYFDFNALMRAVRRDPEMRKYINNVAQEAVS